jgi:phosphoglycerate dehydrogenase-like enzyme
MPTERGPHRMNTRRTPENTKLTICVWHPFDQWRPKPAMAEAIRNRWPKMHVVHLPNYTNLQEELPDTDIFVGYSLRPQQLKEALQLQWIHSTASGVAQLMYPELRESGIFVTNTRGIFATPMAEHAMGLLLALARNFPDSVRHQDRAHWGQQEIWDQPQRLTELNGQVLLIIGFGSIGQELAHRAKAFGMSVWAANRSGQADSAGFADKIVPVSQLAEVLPHADFVVIAAPETPDTRHLIGPAELSRMKASARLINLARGSLLDETALIQALQQNQLGGAALDVTSVEPLPADSPLWRAPRLLITPHTSAVSDRLWTRQTDLLLQLLEKWFAGQELFNRVDFAKGY